jgi:ATP-dependent exoDNAse (exonuclease V) beta subunit
MNNSELNYPYTHEDLLLERNSKNDTNDTNNTDDVLEWKYFLQFIKDYPHFKPYRTEWFIYDESVKLAGSIDMVYENLDGSIMIYDWKRSKEITRINNFNKYATNPLICQMPDSNFWHYALQLNTYKYILEKNYGKKVTDLVLVRLHPNNEEQTYELITLPDLTQDVHKLFEERKSKLYI